VILFLFFPAIETPLTKADKIQIFFNRKFLIPAENIYSIGAFSFSGVSCPLRIEV